ncbi:sulfurtransferase TusA family protein [candidate division WOR-3 bacterium]|nr:sulfurtransferase TusA family protein [candidate division WOR-3 bacterium]
MDNIDQIVDARGLACPMPIVKLSQAMTGMEVGQTVEVTATDHSFVPDIEAWCRKTGHQLIEVNEAEEEIKAYVKKTK